MQPVQGYSEYVSRIQGLRIRGRREVRGNGGEQGEVGGQEVAEILQFVTEIDGLDCGKVYVCEVSKSSL